VCVCVSIIFYFRIIYRKFGKYSIYRTVFMNAATSVGIQVGIECK